MSELAAHYFVIIGDSYTEGYTGGGVTIDSWSDWFETWYGSEWLGDHVDALGGSGFAHPNKPFLNLLNNANQELSDHSMVTDVLVAGGYNDGSFVAQLPAKISEFATYARQYFPNATLWIAPIGWTLNHNQQIVSQAIEAYITYGKQYGYRVLEEMKYVMRNTAYFSTDEIHPNESGYKALASSMHTYLLSYLSAPKIKYNGSDRWKIKATELLNESGANPTNAMDVATKDYVDGQIAALRQQLGL